MRHMAVGVEPVFDFFKHKISWQLALFVYAFPL